MVIYIYTGSTIYLFIHSFFFFFCIRKQELQKKKSRGERRVELGEIKSMLKPHAHTTLFNLCFRSKRLSKTTSQKQPANSKSYGQTLQRSRKSLFPQKDPCSILIAKGILFLTTLLFSLLCGCWDGKTTLYTHFQLLQCAFPPLLSVRSCTYI